MGKRKASVSIKYNCKERRVCVMVLANCMSFIQNELLHLPHGSQTRERQEYDISVYPMIDSTAFDV